MKVAYFAGLGLIVTFAGMAIVLSGEYEAYWDIPSFLVVAGCSYGALVCNFGFRGAMSAIAALLSPGTDVSAGFRKSAAKTVILASLIGGLFFFVQGLIAGLSNLGAPETVGPMLGVGLISLMYGSFLALLAVPAYVAGE